MTKSNYSYNLSEHVLYGSSRLGTHQYWPQQYYSGWSDTGVTPSFLDTGLLSLRFPWYSLKYNDAIRGDSLWEVGNTQTEKQSLLSYVGQRCYELTNHLGNVQAVVSDNRRDVADGTDTIRRYHAMIPSAYDYYPFGMLMLSASPKVVQFKSRISLLKSSLGISNALSTIVFA